MRFSAHLPEHMTYNGAFEERAQEPIITGRPLTRRFMNYLEASCEGLTTDERRRQLQDLNPPLYDAYRLAERGRSTEEIAEQLNISRRSAQRRVREARAWVGAEPRRASDEDRLHALEVRDEQAFVVFVLSKFGWKQDTIAGLLNCSVPTVKRAMARARDALGDVRLTNQQWDRLAIHEIGVL